MLPFIFFDIIPSYSTSEVFFVRVDPGIKKSEELLSSLYYMLWFPGYFGFNWNSLFDFLMDLSWVPLEKVVISHDSLPDLPPEDLVLYLEVLRDAVVEFKRDGRREFSVLFNISDRGSVAQLLKQ